MSPRSSWPADAAGRLRRGVCFASAAVVLFAGACAVPYAERGTIEEGAGWSGGVSGNAMLYPVVSIWGGSDEWNGAAIGSLGGGFSYGFSRRTRLLVAANAAIESRYHDEGGPWCRALVGARVGSGGTTCWGVDVSYWPFSGMRVPAADLVAAWDGTPLNTFFVRGGMSGLGLGMVHRTLLSPRVYGYLNWQLNLLLPAASLGVGLELAPATRAQSGE